METQKKEWKTPELIVLVRSKPEEAVLAACKNTTTVPNGPTTNNTGCMVWSPGCTGSCAGAAAS